VPVRTRWDYPGSSRDDPELPERVRGLKQLSAVDTLRDLARGRGAFAPPADVREPEDEDASTEGAGSSSVAGSGLAKGSSKGKPSSAASSSSSPSAPPAAPAPSRDAGLSQRPTS